MVQLVPHRLFVSEDLGWNPCIETESFLFTYILDHYYNQFIKGPVSRFEPRSAWTKNLLNLSQGGHPTSKKLKSINCVCSLI
jgi:hypothetical protein